MSQGDVEDLEQSFEKVKPVDQEEKQKKGEVSYANSAINYVNTEITKKYGVSRTNAIDNSLGVKSSRNCGNPHKEEGTAWAQMWTSSWTD